MLEYLKKEANRTETENGAAALKSTGSDCLDLFATAGALRGESEAKVEAAFMRAFTENKDLAMKLLFFARDVRGGLGERRLFRVALRWLAGIAPESVIKNIPYVAEYGRFDDLLVLVGTPCENAVVEYLKDRLEADLAALKEDGEVSLLGKWLPSVNASSYRTVSLAKKLSSAFGMSCAEYRRALTALRARIRIIENNLRERDYTFDYAKQPSRALFKYRAAFDRNDGDRYFEFLNRVEKGEAKLHTDNLCPYELVSPCLQYTWDDERVKPLTPAEEKTLNVTWANLPDYCGEEDALAVIDTSGSMYYSLEVMPASVALSLGLYFAERNKGRFKGHFIEFSEEPELIEIKGETFVERLRYIASFNKVANTNVEAVFDLVLDTAVKNSLPQSEMPARLIVISDMEFDQCVDNSELTVFENAKAKYEAAGYKLPELVFWNVCARNGHQPVEKNEQGVALVSGATPRLFSMIAGGITDPYVFMMEVLGSERYAKINA